MKSRQTLRIRVAVVTATLICILTSVRDRIESSSDTGMPPPDIFACGPAALLRAACACDARAARRLARVLSKDDHAARPPCTLADLARWARSAGLAGIGVHMPADSLGRPGAPGLPVIAHLTGDHFVAVLDANDIGLHVADGPFLTKSISRQDFDRCFSGYALCLRCD